MNKAYLILGGNMGNRAALIETAIGHISRLAGRIVSSSSQYETEAWGMDNASTFLNKIILVETEKNAQQLLEILLGIESEMGRKRTEKKYESREIDIDILFFNSEIIHSENLVIPHPLLHKRRFVLEPLVEMQADFLHPVLKKTAEQLLANCDDTTEVKRITDAKMNY